MDEGVRRACVENGLFVLRLFTEEGEKVILGKPKVVICCPKCRDFTKSSDSFW